MKCDHCTWKECSKKIKTNDQENATVNVRSPAQENGGKGEFHKLANAKIFLSDCLACDSCVTTEEGVQVSQQNTKDFFRVLNLNKICDTSQHKVLAVSKTAAFSKALGHTVFDMKIAADFSNLESQKEFVHRYCQHREEEPRLPMLTSACPSWNDMQSVCWVTPSPPPLHSQVSPTDHGLSGEGLLHQTAEPVPRQDFPHHCGPVL
ncbi:hypothetical protein QTO34_000272 [Cnephaeus nilssonii]|uniref:Iron hydrogenase large subunit C-terminal domain-containing protein n=1 Tax=Cnephaeus nilssonii TaxID=3371016 RepID=A0AA40IBY9_CNENI|nr:hypothetical protein QTO34_000272 [Eptesicus nilssonii]